MQNINLGLIKLINFRWFKIWYSDDRSGSKGRKDAGLWKQSRFFSEVQSIA